MAVNASTSLGDTLNISLLQSIDRLKMLYPAVNEEETPLPRSWSPKDKFNYIGLSQNNLRVHYKGQGKSHKDAASVRATHPVPASCGVYYFEVKIISKGRDGYMGIGLSAQGVSLNKLPGWDKHSYGYHGDDGNAFCSSGAGQPYGPTFTTGDVIGCCVNFIDNTCFYTKNGVNLGVAFTDVPPNLYPTVGLQTPGEVVEANFGQSPFIFDIDDYMQEWRLKTKQTIDRFPVKDKKGEWQTALQKIVSTYLVHHGYCATAEAFARNTGQAFEEELTSIKNRQRIQGLVLAGRMGEAIETTQHLYPGLLHQNANLLFMLKCRQFVEMVNGTDSEVRGGSGSSNIRSPKSRRGSSSTRSSPSMSPVHLNSSVHVHSSSTLAHQPHSGSNSPSRVIPTTVKPSYSNTASTTTTTTSSQNLNSASTTNTVLTSSMSETEMNATNNVMNGEGHSRSSPHHHNETDMDSTELICDERTISNGTSATNGVCVNGVSSIQDQECDMEVDQLPLKRQLCGGSQAAIEKMLHYGRELQSMSQQLRREYGKNETNKKALQDAFSLLAYSDPWNSPVGYQLDPVQREPVCAALNSAILESHNLPKQPPLELAIGQATECMKLMSKVGIGACAFAGVADYLH